MSVDLNLQVHEDLLTGDSLRTAIRDCLTKPDDFFSNHRFRRNSRFDEHLAKSSLRAIGYFLADRLDDAKRKLRQKETYTFDLSGAPKSNRPLSIFDNARRILFLSPLLHCSYSHSNQGYYLSTSDLHHAAKYFLDSPYFDYFHKSLLNLDYYNADVIGCSISFAEQIIPAVTLSKVIKKLWPDRIILVGGNYITLMFQRLIVSPGIFDVFDGIVCGDGEGTLLQIGENIKHGRDWHDKVDNLSFKNESTSIQPISWSKWDYKQSPIPDFDDFKLNQYFVAHPQLVYMTARGCYWGKCSFCNYAATHKDYQSTDVEKVVFHLKTLAEKYSISSFYLSDDAIHPKRIYQIAKQLLKENIKLNWWCLSRFDRTNNRLWSKSEIEDIVRAGCYRVFFGGESVDECIQESMAKGFDASAIRNSLEEIIDSELHAHISMIIGAPGESLESADKTINWCLESSANPGISARIHRFRLAYNSPLSNDSSILECCDDNLTNLAPNILNYRELTKCEEEHMTFRENISRLKNNFLNNYNALPLHCYPENHNYEGLQYQHTYGGKLPTSSEKIYDSDILKRKIVLSPTIAYSLNTKHDVELISQGYTVKHSYRQSELIKLLVLFDLRNERYLVLSEELNGLFEEIEHGIVVSEAKDMTRHDPDSIVELIDYLLINNWICLSLE